LGIEHRLTQPRTPKTHGRVERLLSAREPSEVLKDRSRQAGFKLLGPANLPRLREHVQAWMQGQR